LLRLLPRPESGSAFIALNEKIHELNGEIARRRTIETARRKSDLALREADRRKDEFLATLAHELRNPLAPIRNAMQLMAMSPADETRTANLRSMVERQLKHLVRLIDDLMDVSRITQGRLELRRERVDLDAILQIAVETSMPLLEGKGHELHVDSTPARIYVDADVTRLAQVFSNLLNNSAKYSPPGSQVSIATRREAGQVIVRFTDTGTGIPPEMLTKIFDMFVQIDRPGGREGLGIGLTLAKRIVELHGGTLEACSEGTGKGSTFLVRLAEASPTVEHLPQTAPARARASHESARVLVADDNKDAAQTLALILQIEGHEVRTAHTGLDALHMAESFRPQIALLDIGMPQMNGYQAAREIRDRPWGHSILLVAVTGWGQEQDLRMASEAGFDRHLVKPVDPQTLTSLISQSRPR
jgi:signal transduction histidine kinase/CheY-like chemotaxis protein